MGNSFNVAAIEEKSRQAWEQANCFHAPESPRGDKFFNFDSGPFPSGPLHLGHVRTYVLGDVTARYQRLLGKCVLYCTEWDAFGLPNELAAASSGVSVREFTAANIERMRAGMIRLGISYDWRRVQSTCNPDYVRWTQWLFTELYKRGLAYRKETAAAWCHVCETSLAMTQAENGRCWRCETPVDVRTIPGWFVRVSRYEHRLREGIEALTAWSEAGRKLLRRGLPQQLVGAGVSGPDWHVSRQRKWGTPIPAVICRRCGIIPDPQLPPDSSETAVRFESLANPEFRTSSIDTPCPQCGAAALRESDTLDCFFDDSWSFLSCVRDLSACFTFPASRLAAWMPVDRFHSGFDTFAYLNLYRFVGHFLHDLGLLLEAEPISSYIGHDMVVTGERKMSKHLGNAVSPDGIIEEFGADALRVAILWSAAPERTLDWQNATLHRAAAFLHHCFFFFAKCQTMLPECSVDPRRGVSSAVSRLEAEAVALWPRVGKLIDAYRPNAAIEDLHGYLQRLKSSLEHRLESRRMNSEETALIAGILRDFAVAISPFAPHLAEELSRMMNLGLIATAKWPIPPV
jgi:leucyl-tRNA synthetase